MEKSPAFQLYPKDILSDGNAMAMPAEAFGIYMKLLLFDWIDDGIVNNDQTLMRLGGYSHHLFDGSERNIDEYEIILSHIRPRFVSHPTKAGYVTNPRLQKERKRQRERSEKAAESANKRWHDKGNANAYANALPTVCSSSSSSSSYKSYSLGVPTLKEWLDHANMIGYEPKEAETAWNKLEAFSWQLQGNAIHDWKKMATVFKTRNQEHASKQKNYERNGHKPSGQRTQTIEEIIDVPTVSYGKNGKKL